ncbi:MAG: protein kinase [Myxococcaceae bacterium]|nr:protein kinase [Myxococcaceae bacterium]
MNALGITYLVLFGVATVLAAVHVAQAIVIRSDRTQAILAIVCLGFGVFDLAITFSSEHTGHPRPVWIGWHLMAAASAATLTVFVPMVAWMVLELKLNVARSSVLVLAALVGLARVVGVGVLARDDSELSWERLHSLDHAWVAIPSVICAVIGGATWVVEGALAARRGVRYARPLAAFGVVGTTASLHGVGVTLGLVSPPDLFGLLTLPVVGFVQVLSSVRFVQALQLANQPAGDMARYEVRAKLGSGGMGEIFLARRKGPAGFLREVVLKTLRGTGTDSVSRERFLAEARLAAQLRHPNLVDVYDLGEQPDGFFIVMEHIAGVTLGEALRRANQRQQPIAPDVVAELGVQLCRALSFAHAAQVIHRDIKRQNVMVSFEGVLKVIDFGIAQEARSSRAERSPVEQSASSKASEGLTAADSIIGTPGYIAPERYDGQPATIASDVFAAGVVLYELLAGRSPFAAGPHGTPAEAERFTPLRELRPDVSAPLAATIEQCLEPAPEKRPPSAASLQVSLEQVLHGRRVELAKWLADLFPSAGDDRALAATPGPTVTLERAEARTTPRRASEVETRKSR